jgi:hypothetical protein
MDIDTHIKAAGFLLVAGFIGGFLVVHKASAMFHTQSPEPENAASTDREAPLGEANRAAKQGPQVAVMMDGDDEPGVASKAQHQGNGQSQTARDGDDDDGTRKDPIVVKIDKNKKNSSAADGDATIDGAAAISFLAGNSVKLEGDRKPPRFIYYAARGLLGESVDHGFRVRRWLERGGRLCTTNAAATLDCDKVEVVVFRPKAKSKPGNTTAKPESTAASPADGEAIGRLIVGSAEFTIVAGNVAKFPAYIPSLDPAAEAEAPAFDIVTAAGDGPLVGRPAWEKIVGVPLAPSSTAPAGAQPPSPRVTYYDPAGFLLEISRESADSAEADLTVAKWTFRNDTLCQEIPGAAQKRPCVRPELSDGEFSNLTNSSGERLSLSHPPARRPSAAMETLGTVHSTPSR